jgi:L-amino acid N-acyltransferase YncA
MGHEIDDMQAGDWLRVAAIYGEGIGTGIATFERSVPTWEEWDKDHSKKCRLVARTGDAILGWAALTPISGRCLYGSVAEASLYVGASNRKQGIGTALLMELIRRSEEAGYWNLQITIIKENRPSRKLCEACGFREIGIRERLGRMPREKSRIALQITRRKRFSDVCLALQSVREWQPTPSPPSTRLQSQISDAIVHCQVHEYLRHA